MLFPGKKTHKNLDRSDVCAVASAIIFYKRMDTPGLSGLVYLAFLPPKSNLFVVLKHPSMGALWVAWIAPIE